MRFRSHAATALTGLPRPWEEDLLDHHLLQQRERGRFQAHDLPRVHALSLVSDADALERPTTAHDLHIPAVEADHRRDHESGQGHQYMTAVPPEFQA
ncbi:MAG: hypothetical protein ABIQ18_41085 [Umezawaea sp.]